MKNATDTELEVLDNVLLSITGQQFRTNEEVIMNYMKYMPLLVECYGNYTIKEIELAFKLARKGDLMNEKNERLKLYRELNFASACDVLLAYEEYKKDKLGSFIQNQTLYLQPTNETPKIDAQIKAVIEFLTVSWEITSKNEFDTLRGAFLYDYFKDLGLVDLSDEEKEEIWNLAFEIIENQKKEEMSLTTDYSLFKQLEKELSKISKKDSEVVIMSKRIAFGYQIRNWQMQDYTIDNIQKMVEEKLAK